MTLFMLGSWSMTGCEGCGVLNVPVSSTADPSAQTPDHLNYQSETSLARLDTVDKNGNPAPHFVVTYLDATLAEASGAPAPACWYFSGGNSLDGWATSDDLARHWTRHPQLAPLSGSPFPARHADSWVAAWSNPALLSSSPAPGEASVVLMVSIAQQGPTAYDGPWGLYVNRALFLPGDTSIDLTREANVALAPTATIPDGPKLAIRGDGTRAIIAWEGYNYEQVTNLHTLIGGVPTAMAVGSPKLLNPMATGAQPPDSNCTSASWSKVPYITQHAQIAAGFTHFYGAAVWHYDGCSDPDPDRIEVYRTETGDAWERIVSVRVPPSLSDVIQQHRLLAQNIAGNPRFDMLQYADRGEDGLSLAVGLGPDGEYLILVTDQVQEGNAKLNEANRERTLQYRIARADLCSADRRDLFSCGGVQNLPPRQLDLVAAKNGMRTLSSRVGVWESKPHAFRAWGSFGTRSPTAG
jgi:hypothetical protein